MSLNIVLGMVAGLSLGLLLWQWLAALRFPLHQRIGRCAAAPAVTVFKPLKGADVHTEKCLRSWFTQDYAGPVQILLGAQSPADPACPIVDRLIAEFPDRHAQFVVTREVLGTNGKISNLAQLAKAAKHDVFVVSDADVLVPPDFLANAVSPFLSVNSSLSDGMQGRTPERMDQSPPDAKAAGLGKLAAQGGAHPGPAVGLVNCFYRLANPAGLAMQWEAVAINADFWSQVLQSRSLKPLDFALGAAMVTRRRHLEEIGGFQALLDCLADDYQLGHRIAKKGYRIELCPVVVECWDPPQTWRSVWKHQLRWARTVRVCQPMPYFLSILSNPTFWPLLWLVLIPSTLSGGFFAACLLIRCLLADNLQRRLTQRPAGLAPAFAPVKDLLQCAVWLAAFAGNHIEWRGQRFHLRNDGTLVPIQTGSPADRSAVNRND